MQAVTKPDVIQQKLPGALSIVLGLLVFSVFINYVDRGNLSIAAPMIKDELGLSPSQLGFLLGSFFWTYGLFQILAGELVDRFNVNWVLAIGFFLWSVATSVTGVLHGFVALFAVRLILGVGESVAYPAYSRILALYFPLSHRSRANSWIMAGLSSGPAFGMLAGGVLMFRFGWRSFFVVLGLASLVWLVPWLRCMPGGPGNAALKSTGSSPGTLEILVHRSAWGSICALFCVNYTLYLQITWLPFYLIRERGFSPDTMAVIGASVFLVQALAAVVGGRYSDHWLARGGTSTRVRKTFLITGAVAPGMCLWASTFVGPVPAVALLLLAGAGIGVSGSNLWATTQTLAGPHASGRWTGLQCGFGNYSGVLATAVTGFALQRTGHFGGAFAVAMGFGLLGALCWAFFVGPIEPVVWKTKTPGILIATADLA